MDKPFSSYNGDAPYIFISYAHDDQNEVFKHIKRLNQEGFRIWYDEGIEPGVNWYETLESRIRNCECILLFISKRAQQSQYISKEITCAIEHNKHVVCIMLDDESLKGPFKLMLCDTQSIKKNEIENVDKFYEKLANSLHPDLTCSNNYKTNEKILLNQKSKLLKIKQNKKNIFFAISFVFLCCFVVFVYSNSKQHINTDKQDQNILQSTNTQKQKINSEIAYLIDAICNHNVEKNIKNISVKIKTAGKDPLYAFDEYLESIGLFLNEYKNYIADVDKLYKYLLTSNEDLIDQNQKNNYIEQLRSFMSISMKLEDFGKDHSEFLKVMSSFKANSTINYRYKILNYAIKFYNFSLSNPNLSYDQCKYEYEKYLDSTYPSEWKENEIAYRQYIMPAVSAYYEFFCDMDKELLIYEKSYHDVQSCINELKEKFSHK